MSAPLIRNTITSIMLKRAVTLDRKIPITVAHGLWRQKPNIHPRWGKKRDPVACQKNRVCCPAVFHSVFGRGRLLANQVEGCVLKRWPTNNGLKLELYCRPYPLLPTLFSAPLAPIGVKRRFREEGLPPERELYAIMADVASIFCVHFTFQEASNYARRGYFYPFAKQTFH